MVHVWPWCSCSSCVSMSDKAALRTRIDTTLASCSPPTLEKQHVIKLLLPACWVSASCELVAQTHQTHLATVCAWDMRLTFHTVHNAWAQCQVMFYFEIYSACVICCVLPTSSWAPTFWAAFESDLGQPCPFRRAGHLMLHELWHILRVVGPPSQETVLEPRAWGNREKGGSAPHEQTGLLEEAAGDQWWLAFHVQASVSLGSQVRKADLSEIWVSAASQFFLHFPHLAWRDASQDPFHRTALYCGNGVESQSVNRD